MIKRMTLIIDSWRGVSIGAIHYYGKLSFSDADGNYQRIELRRTLDTDAAFKLTKQKNHSKNPDYWIDFSTGDTTECFDTEKELRDLAIATWKDHCPDAQLLICGQYACGDPQEILAADELWLMVTINELWEMAETINYYDGGHEEFMMKISKIYSTLVE